MGRRAGRGGGALVVPPVCRPRLTLVMPSERAYGRGGCVGVSAVPLVRHAAVSPSLVVCRAHRVSVRAGWSSGGGRRAARSPRARARASFILLASPAPSPLDPPSPRPRRIQVSTHLWTCFGCPLDRAAAPAARELAAACAIESARVVESAWGAEPAC